MAIDTRAAVGALAAGRVALGLAVLAAPEQVTSRWLGAHARHPAVRYLSRSLGARDVALGALALATLGDARTAARVQLACASADAVDALATIEARDELPAIGVVGTVTIAGAAALAGVELARRLARA
jgi:hypothetical protein